MKTLRLIFLLFFIISLSSCLTVEKKEYTFVFTGENSGLLTIKYINIMSALEDGKDVSRQDFNDLIETYYYGYQMEEDYPEARVIDKQLFVENEQLCALVTIEFRSLSAARLYQRTEDGPVMFCVKSAYDMEEYSSSNGQYGGSIMPVVFWPDDESQLELSTTIMAPDETTRSLVSLYRQWKSN
jgi:hypothetical protein